MNILIKWIHGVDFAVIVTSSAWCWPIFRECTVKKDKNDLGSTGKIGEQFAIRLICFVLKFWHVVLWKVDTKKLITQKKKNYQCVLC